MTLEDAERLARDLIGRHAPPGWGFRFDRARCRLGSCCYRTRVITLSRHLTLLNDERVVRDTVLHEIAHALTPGAGHGERWREACRRLGARPRATACRSEVVMPAAPLHLVCSACGTRYPRYRRSRGLYRCGHCPSDQPLRWVAAAG